MADPTLFTTVSDNTLLPFGDRMIARGDDNSSARLDISSIFEDGFLFGTERFDALQVATNGGVSFGLGYHGWPDPNWENSVIAPFLSDLDTRFLPEDPDVGVFFDLNSDRDSVVVTWNQVNYYYSPDPDVTLTFQLEIIDLGEDDAEVVFRYSDMQDPGGDYYYYSIGAATDTPPRIALRGDNWDSTAPLPKPGELDVLEGNTSVSGVWQFRVIDGLLQTEDLIVNDEIGTEGDDVMIGSVFADRLDGADGNDTIEGGNGDDILLGGDGDDYIEAGNGQDHVFGGTGNDRILSTSSGYRDDDVLEGMEGDDWIAAFNGNDILAGQAGNDVLAGGFGTDQLFGGDGDDFLWGGVGRDEATGGEGADRFFVSHLGGDSLHIMDYDAAEGDRLVFDGRWADRSEVQVRRTFYTDADGTTRSEDLSVVLMVTEFHQRTLFTFENEADIDQIILRLPLPRPEIGDVVTFDLL